MHACALSACIIIKEPTSVLIGKEWDWINQRGELKLVEVKHYGYTIDLFAGLEVIYYKQLLFVIYSFVDIGSIKQS